MKTSWKLTAALAAALTAIAPLRAAAGVPPIENGNGRMPSMGTILVKSPVVKRFKPRPAQGPVVNPSPLMFAPSAAIAPGVSTCGDFADYGTIGADPAIGYTVNGESTGFSLSYGTERYFIRNSWVKYDVTAAVGSAAVQTSHDSGILTVAGTADKKIAGLATKLTAGASRYSEGSLSFTQPFISGALERGGASANAGLSWTAGDAPRYGASPFGMVRLNVTRQASAFVSYASRDFNKIIVNNYLLPPAGVDCSDCSKDALNIGITYNTGSRLTGTVGIYDFRDLRSPFGNLSMNWEL